MPKSKTPSRKARARKSKQQLEAVQETLADQSPTEASKRAVENNLPDNWSTDLGDDRPDRELRASAAVARLVDASTHIANSQDGRGRIRTFVSLWSGGPGEPGVSEGENMLAVDDYCTPAESLDLCRCIAHAIQKFRADQIQGDASRFGICEEPDGCLPVQSFRKLEKA